jgi:photosystem II stability/assembly factor-like uncharacterized protein
MNQEETHMIRFLSCLCAVLLATASHAGWRNDGPFVGVVTDVAIDSSHPDTIYAATHSGGVWRSDDGGQSWALPGDGLIGRGSIKWITTDPATRDTIWAGLDALGKPALWRSSDRGKTWAPVRPDKTSYMLGQPIAFAPTNPSIVYAPSTNLHYRSADGGKTWESFRVPEQDAYAFAIDPKNPKIIYAGGRGREHHVRRSSDGGKTWKPASEGLPESSIDLLAIPRELPSTIYAVIGFGQLFKSEDSGKSWTELDVGLSGTDKLFSLDLDPHDAQTILAGTENGLRRSTDGGESWSTVGGGLGNWYCKGVAFHPKSKDTVYAGTTGTGFFKSTDGGESFAPSNTGFGAGWVEKIYAPPNGTGPVFAQLSVGLFRMDSPGVWKELQSPFDPGDTVNIDGVLFDRQSPKRVYAHDGGKWWRSEDAGKSWQEIEVPQPGMRDMMRGKMSGPEFYGLTQDPGDPKIFYAGGSQRDTGGGVAVNRSTNGGKKWEAAGAGLTGDVRLLRAAAPGVVYAVTSKNGIYRTSDGGKSWSSVRAGEIRDIAIDPTKPERVFVATKEGLYRSTDSGATWTKVSKGMKEDDIEAVAVSATGKAFCGSFAGVFMSADGGDTWTAFNDGLTNTDVRALAVAGGSAPRLYAGVAGGSVQSIELP